MASNLDSMSVPSAVQYCCELQHKSVHSLLYQLGAIQASTAVQGRALEARKPLDFESLCLTL